MQKTPVSPASHIIIMKEILQCFIDNHPEKAEHCKPMLADMRMLIDDYKALLDSLYEDNRRQTLIILTMAAGCHK